MRRSPTLDNSTALKIVNAVAHPKAQFGVLTATARVSRHAGEKIVEMSITSGTSLPRGNVVGGFTGITRVEVLTEPERYEVTLRRNPEGQYLGTKGDGTEVTMSADVRLALDQALAQELDAGSLGEPA